MVKEEKDSYTSYKELIKGKSDRQLMETIALNLKKIEISLVNLANSPGDLTMSRTTERVNTRPNMLNVNYPNEKIHYYNYENREEVWDKQKEEFERTAEEISKENDFFVLHDNSLREKWVKKNYPGQKNVKELVKRALVLYKSRVRNLSFN